MSFERSLKQNFTMENEDCPWYKETVYKHDYKDKRHIFDFKKETEELELLKTEEARRAERAKLDSYDPVLINGQFARNLHVKNELMPYIVKDHPMVKNRHEEYEHFLNRFKNCQCCKFCRDFSEPPVDFEKTFDMLRRQRKSVYQNDYSCTSYGRNYTDRFMFMKPQHVSFKDVSDFSRVANGTNYKPSQRTSVNDILKTGTSVYYNEISQKAQNRIKIVGPLDPFTSRKV